MSKEHKSEVGSQQSEVSKTGTANTKTVVDFKALPPASQRAIGMAATHDVPPGDREAWCRGYDAGRAELIGG